MTRKEMQLRYAMMVEDFNQGIKVEAIAVKFNVNKSTITRALRRAGVPPQKPWASQRLKKHGLPPTQDAESLYNILLLAPNRPWISGREPAHDTRAIRLNPQDRKLLLSLLSSLTTLPTATA